MKQMTNRKIWMIGLIFLSFTLIFLAFSLINSKAETSCGMDTGPIYGKKINIQLNNLKIDKYLTIPDGQLAISNTNNYKISTDTIPPILLKFDKKNNLVWAIKLDSKQSGIPLYEMENIILKDDKNGKRITFFNLSYSEPGTIYLTDKFEFDHLCLKAF